MLFPIMGRVFYIFTWQSWRVSQLYTHRQQTNNSRNFCNCLKLLLLCYDKTYSVLSNIYLQGLPTTCQARGIRKKSEQYSSPMFVLNTTLHHTYGLGKNFCKNFSHPPQYYWLRHWSSVRSLFISHLY